MLPYLVTPVAALEEVGGEVLRFMGAGSGVDATHGPLAGLALTSTTELVAVVGAYVLLIVWGLAQRSADPTGEHGSKRSALLKPFMILYNTVQVALCGWMAVMAASELVDQRWDVVCSGQRNTRDGMAVVLYIFYVSKVLDMLDTVFMIIKCVTAGRGEGGGARAARAT
jgi:uncharacterized membrane-anchored protein